MMPANTYRLALTRQYVSRWGVKEAVRELIQNAIDSPAPFVYTFANTGGDAFELRLTSEGITLSPQTLLLGASTKAEDEQAIGSFGEGYKLAMLVLAREGLDFGILNGDVEWRPRFEFSRQFASEMLVVDEFRLPEHYNNALTFRVGGLDEQRVEEIRTLCLRMQDDIGEIKRTPMGDILMDRPGKLYVGGLFVCDTELQFGYDVLPQYITLERDRCTVSGWDMKTVTRDMWYATKDYDRIADLIGSETPDLEYGQYSMPDMVKEACYQHFRKAHPKDVIARTDAELKALVKQGMTVYVGGSTYHHGVSTSASYRAEPRSPAAAPPLPVTVLERWLAANRKQMRGAAIEAFRKELINEAAVTWVAK